MTQQKLTTLSRHDKTQQIFINSVQKFNDHINLQHNLYHSVLCDQKKMSNELTCKSSADGISTLQWQKKTRLAGQRKTGYKPCEHQQQSPEK